MNVFAQTAFLFPGTAAIGATGGLFLLVVMMAIYLFYSVVYLNQCGAMVKVYYGQPIKVTEPYTELKNNFWRKLGGMCWMHLWVYLWSLLLIVPGIIKGLSYSMTYYILACHPNVKATDALELSKRMTHGYKWKIFVMHLSFLGWGILSAFTWNILGIFYVFPYMYASYAGMFVELRHAAIMSGAIHPAELEGFDGAYPHYPQPTGHIQSPPYYPPQQLYGHMPQYHQQQNGHMPQYHQQQQYGYMQQSHYMPTLQYPPQTQYPPPPQYGQHIHTPQYGQYEQPQQYPPQQPQSGEYVQYYQPPPPPMQYPENPQAAQGQASEHTESSQNPPEPPPHHSN